MSRARNVLLCVGLLALMAIPATALSQGGIESGWTYYPPNLNGKLASGEWTDATRVKLHPLEGDFVAAPLGGQLGDLTLGEDVSTEQVSGWARFMNDNRYLYLAVSLDIGAPAGDPDYWGTTFYFLFEDEPTLGDGRWAANFCTQSPDEGGYISKSAHYVGTDYDYDYFAPASEDAWCTPWRWMLRQAIASTPGSSSKLTRGTLGPRTGRETVRQSGPRGCSRSTRSRIGPTPSGRCASLRKRSSCPNLRAWPC